jgi:hypothetical protein
VIADAVWDELLSGHAISGSAGEALSAAGTAGDPWTTLLPGAYGAGTAGKLVGDNINATISSRATQTSVDDLPTNAELATALGTADDAVLTAIGDLPTNAELATALAAADDAVLAQVALVKAVTDKLNTTLTSIGSPGQYVFTVDALSLAPTGGSTPPTAAEIADAVWDELLAGHLGAGSTGAQLNNAASAGNPWASIIEGSYTAQDIIRILAAVAVGKTLIVPTGSGGATITFRSMTDATDLVVATATAAPSERTSVTLAP